MGVTQKDVADRAGVTRAVVSHVMHGGAGTIRVSEQTAELVRAAAREMGYQPNNYARNFRRRRTGMIGVLHGSDVERFRFGGEPRYFATLMDGIVDGAFRHGYTVGICPDLFGPTPEQAMADGRFDGLIWYHTRFSAETEARLASCVAPLVLIHSEARRFDFKFPSVLCDNRGGMQLAVEHLVSRGHSRIGYLCDSKHDSEESVTRFRCLQELGKERKLSIRKVELGERRFGLEQYFSYVKPETALIAHSDEYAVEAVQIAQRRGVRIPHDFSIIGFDSTPFCEYQSPPLTSISQPLEQMGSIAVDRLVERIEGLPCSSIETVVPCGLDVRGSTGYV